MPLATNGKIPRRWLKNGKLVLNGNVHIYYQCKTAPTSAINEHLTQGAKNFFFKPLIINSRFLDFDPITALTVVPFDYKKGT